MGQNMSDDGPKPGDLIEFDRGVYQHWAVYVGDGYVVQLAREPNLRDQTKRAMVKKDKLEVVAENKPWKINNSLDRKYNPRSADVIVREANKLVGQEQTYSIMTNNCEHFVNKLRYGRAVSLQVENACSTM